MVFITLKRKCGLICDLRNESYVFICSFSTSTNLFSKQKRSESIFNVLAPKQESILTHINKFTDGPSVFQSGIMVLAWVVRWSTVLVINRMIKPEEITVKINDMINAVNLLLYSKRGTKKYAEK